MQELTTIHSDNIPALFAEGGTADVIAQIEAEARSVIPDVSTAKGRKQIASTAAKVARSKTYLDGLGKELVSDLKKQTGAVDQERRAMRERLDALKIEVRQPLTEFEDAEQAKQQAFIDRISKIGGETPQGVAELRAYIEGLELISINDDAFGSYIGMAATRKDSEIQRIRAMLKDAEAEEKRQAEAAALAERERIEREKRIAADAAEAATRAAQQAELDRVEKARHEEECKRIAQEREIIEAERRANAAERARAESEAQAQAQAAKAAEAATRAAEAKARAAEKERLDLERQIAEEDARRAADLKHRARINSEALDGLCGIAGMNREIAKAVVVAVAKGEIAHLVVEY